jgi:hypothetical protein
MSRLALILSLVLIVGCESTNAGTKGIGSGTDDYKRSPCACEFKAIPAPPKELLPA